MLHFTAVGSVTLLNVIAPECAGVIWKATASLDGGTMDTVAAPEVALGFCTSTDAVPVAATSAAPICATTSPAETYWVVLAVPFHCTTEDPVKPFPSTVRRKGPVPA